MATARTKGRAKVEEQAQALEVLTVEYVDRTSISPNTYNPNRQSEHDFQLLVRSMREDGFTQPVIVHSGTREIVDGEHRWRAAAELGIDSIPVVFVEMTPEQMRVATLRHNRARGSEDFDLTAQLLRDLQSLGALDWAQGALMMDDTEMNRLLEDVTAADALAAPDFSEAWTPAPREVGEDGYTSETNLAARVSYTTAAVESAREQRAAVAAAQTEEDRAQAKRDFDFYRVSMVFDGEEAAIVKAVLEPAPAQKVLELCRRAIAAGEAVEPVRVEAAG